MENSSEKSGNTNRKLSFTEVMDCLVEEGFRESWDCGIPGNMPLPAGRLERLLEISGAKTLEQFLEFVFQHSGDHQTLGYGRSAISRALVVFDRADGKFTGKLESLIESIEIEDVRRNGDCEDDSKGLGISDVMLEEDPRAANERPAKRKRRLVRKSELRAALKELESKYYALVWFARQDPSWCRDDHPAMPRMMEVAKNYPGEVNALRGNLLHYSHGFHSGCLAAFRLVLELLDLLEDPSELLKVWPEGGFLDT